MIKIIRQRYAIVDKNKNLIFCGLARDYTFKKLNDIGDTAIKTYRSEAQARDAFFRSWGDDRDIQIIKVNEIIEDVKQ